MAVASERAHQRATNVTIAAGKDYFHGWIFG
jgi:hypothetical protein